MQLRLRAPPGRRGTEAFLYRVLSEGVCETREKATNVENIPLLAVDVNVAGPLSEEFALSTTIYRDAHVKPDAALVGERGTLLAL